MSTFSYNLRFLVLNVFVVLALFALPTLVNAQANPEMNYQGKLTNSAGVAVPDGLYNMKYWLIGSSTAATSTALWSEVRTTGDRVQVTNGLFSVMLGEVSSLTGVDFNQTLYLGVEVGGLSTTTPVWDGEMSPRKILGTVPAAFVANYAVTAGAASSSDSALTASTSDNSLLLGGVASTSFLRSDEADTMEATSSSALLTLIQNGAGKVMSLFSGLSEVFTVLNNGNVGVGTSTPVSQFAIEGNPGINPFLIASSSGASLMSLNQAGYLGLGTDTPGERLEVVGNIISKGTEWTLRTSTTTNEWYGVTYGNGLFVAVANTGSDNRVMSPRSGFGSAASVA